MESLVAHTSASAQYNIYLISGDLALKDLALLNSIVKGKNNVDLKYINITDSLDLTNNLFIDRHLTTAAYWRFLLPELLAEIDKVLYLDTDVIVCDDIATIFDTDIGGYYFAGCLDQAVFCCDFGDFKLSKKILYQIGYTDFSSYVNSGVLLFNLNLLRTNKISAKLLECAAKYNFIFHDQDVINVIGKGRIKLLDERWNFTTHLCPQMYSINNQKAMIKMIVNWNIGIIHYPGAFKPWNSDNGSLYMVWRRYALKSPYFSKNYRDQFQQNAVVTLPMRIKATLRKNCPKVLWEQLRHFKSYVYQDNIVSRGCKHVLPKSMCSLLKRIRNYFFP